MISVLIPSKNEPYLQRTIDDLKEKAETDIEVLWREDYGIGQRALTNELAREAKYDYIMKVDAHCVFSSGFDKEILDKIQDNEIVAPRLLVLDEEKWKPRPEPKSSSYCFDTKMVMQYNTKDENYDIINETMCLQGSAWCISKENYWKWNVCDESIGSWGHQGVELGITAWLNGGKCVTNKLCHYGHLFRENEQDFPYERDKKEIKKTSERFKKRFKNKSIAGLIEKYNYPCDWDKEKVALLPNK